MWPWGQGGKQWGHAKGPNACKGTPGAVVGQQSRIHGEIGPTWNEAVKIMMCTQLSEVLRSENW